MANHNSRADLYGNSHQHGLNASRPKTNTFSSTSLRCSSEPLQSDTNTDTQTHTSTVPLYPDINTNTTSQTQNQTQESSHSISDISTTPSTAIAALPPHILIYHPAGYNHYHYTLHSIASQFAHIPQYHHHALPASSSEVCQYHASILDYESIGAVTRSNYYGTIVAQVNDELGDSSWVLERYLNGGPAEQYALHNRGETDVLCTEKGCVCGQI